jgi:hypothetical protein
LKKSADNKIKIVSLASVFAIITSLVVAGSALAAPLIDINITVDPSFTDGDEMQFDYSLVSTEDVEIEYVVGISCPNAPQGVLDIQTATLSAGVALAGSYSWGELPFDIPPQECEARVDVIGEVEAAASEKFSVENEETVSYKLMLCKDEDCKEQSTVFLIEEEIFLDYYSEEDITVEAYILNSKGEKQNIDIPSSVSYDHMDTFEIVAVGSAEGMIESVQTAPFAVLDEIPKIIPLSECDSDGECEGGETNDNCPQDCPGSGSDILSTWSQVMFWIGSVLAACMLACALFIIFARPLGYENIKEAVCKIIPCCKRKCQTKKK